MDFNNYAQPMIKTHMATMQKYVARYEFKVYKYPLNFSLMCFSIKHVVELHTFQLSIDKINDSNHESHNHCSIRMYLIT